MAQNYLISLINRPYFIAISSSIYANDTRLLSGLIKFVSLIVFASEILPSKEHSNYFSETPFLTSHIRPWVEFFVSISPHPSRYILTMTHSLRLASICTVIFRYKDLLRFASPPLYTGSVIVIVLDPSMTMSLSLSLPLPPSIAQEHCPEEHHGPDAGGASRGRVQHASCKPWLRPHLQPRGL